AGVVGDVFAKAGEGDDVGKTILGAGVDRLAHLLDAHVVVLRIVHSLVEPVTAGNGADQAVFFQRRPILGIDQLDALATEVDGDLAHFLDVPVLLKTPLHDGLVDGAFLYACLVGPGGSRQGQGSGRCHPSRV